MKYNGMWTKRDTQQDCKWTWCTEATGNLPWSLARFSQTCKDGMYEGKKIVKTAKKLFSFWVKGMSKVQLNVYFTSLLKRQWWQVVGHEKVIKLY